MPLPSPNAGHARRAFLPGAAAQYGLEAAGREGRLPTFCVRRGRGCQDRALQGGQGVCVCGGGGRCRVERCVCGGGRRCRVDKVCVGCCRVGKAKRGGPSGWTRQVLRMISNKSPRHPAYNRFIFTPSPSPGTGISAVHPLEARLGPAPHLHALRHPQHCCRGLRGRGARLPPGHL